MSFARGDIARSADLFRKAGEVRQEDFQSPMLLGQSLRMLGFPQEAFEASREGVRRAERVLALNPLDSRALSLGSAHLFELGYVDKAMAWSRLSLEHYPDDVSTLISAACLHVRAGHPDMALDFLERVWGRGWGKRDWIDHDPDYDTIRDHPRFKKLLEKLK